MAAVHDTKWLNRSPEFILREKAIEGTLERTEAGYEEFLVCMYFKIAAGRVKEHKGKH